MKKRFIILAILLGSILFCYGNDYNKKLTSQTDSLIEFLSDSIPKLINSQQIPGLSIAVVNSNSVLWKQSFGFTDTIKNIPVTPSTLFSVQSISKNFTTAAVLIAVQEGLLDLDTPISHFLPDFTVKSRYESNPENIITLRHLLNHRAGFTHEASIGNNYYPVGSFDEHINSISETWLRFPVNERFSYSNLGVDLAGYILERVSGVPFHKYVEEKVLNPLGMNLSTFNIEQIKKNSKKALGNRANISVPVDIPMVPSGGLYSNVEELGIWLQFHLKKGKINNNQLINESLLDEMYKIPNMNERQTLGYGLGTSIIFNGQDLVFSHGGNGFGFTANITWYPKYNTGIVILINSVNHNILPSLPEYILNQFITSEAGEIKNVQELLINNDKIIIEKDSLVLKKLAGTYLYNGGGRMFLIYKNGRLGVESGDKFVPFNFIAENEAYYQFEQYQVYYRFITDHEGNSEYIIRLHDGEHLDFMEGLFEPPGPDKNIWEKYIGTYSYLIMGNPTSWPLTIRKRNGYLYIANYIRLNEHIPGLFFTDNGEVLDLRDSTHSTWRNIKIEKIR